MILKLNSFNNEVKLRVCCRYSRSSSYPDCRDMASQKLYVEVSKMTEEQPKLSKPEALQQTELLKHTTHLCNEMDRLVALHQFFYQAVEHLFDEQGPSPKVGLSLFPTWLRQREIKVLESLHLLQKGLRKCSK